MDNKKVHIAKGYLDNEYFIFRDNGIEIKVIKKGKQFKSVVHRITALELKALQEFV